MASCSQLFRTRHALAVAAALLVACTDEPSAPGSAGGPELSVVTSTDPTRIVTVGVDAPANLTLKGTVAAVVIAVNNAVVDLSHATVDCAGQSTPDDPRIGVWIQSGRSHVTVKGGGTGVIDHCGVAVLIGSPTPGGGAPGGSASRVTGLHIQHVNCPQGPFEITDRVCDIAIALANSHDDVIDSNTISNVSEGGILVYGTNRAAAVSGNNTLSNNVMVGGFNSYGMELATDGNTARRNVSNDPIEGVIIAGGANQVSDNQIFHSTQGVAFGIHILPGAVGNTILHNQIQANDADLLVEAGATGNLLRQNSGGPTSRPDAIDRNGNCTANSWIQNDFTRSDPACILGVTLDAVFFPPPATLQLDAPSGAHYTASITNQGSRLTDIAVRSWIVQGPFTSHAGGAFAVDCGGQTGTLPKGACTVSGDSALANSSAAGTGTLAAGPAQAVVELVHVITGDTIVLDSRVAAVTVLPPASGAFWELGAPMPTARGELGVAAMNGQLYAVGGSTITFNNSETETIDQAVEVYDPATGSWTSRTPMPTARAGLGVAAVNGVLYAVGGYNIGFNGSNLTAAVEAYDPATNQWTAKAPLPTPRSGLAVAVVNGVLYTIGGDLGGFQVATVQAYDPATNSWTVKAPMPTARSALVAGVVNGIIYAIGGSAGPVVEAYDPATDTWTTRAAVPLERTSSAAGAVDGRLYVVGNEFQETNEAVYDPASDSWTILPSMPTPRIAPAAVGIGSLLFTTGGHIHQSFFEKSVNVLEIYHP